MYIVHVLLVSLCNLKQSCRALQKQTHTHTNADVNVPFNHQKKAETGPQTSPKPHVTSSHCPAESMRKSRTEGGPGLGQPRLAVGQGPDRSDRADRASRARSGRASFGPCLFVFLFRGKHVRGPEAGVDQ